MSKHSFPTSRIMSPPKRYAALRLTLRTVVFTVVLAMGSPHTAHALALGEVTVRSALGQRLDAIIDIASISAAESESLAVRLAPVSMFSDAGLEFGALQRSLRLSVEKKADRASILVSSDLPVNDPFLMVLIEVDAAGNRTIRQYALLLDPPVTDRETQRTTAIDPPVAASTPVPAQPIPQPALQPAPTAATATTENTKPAEQRAASSTRVVRRGDTLNKFAREILPPGATLEQALLAYLQANPRAFEGKNIHRMKTGSVLRVPDDQAIADISAAEARREVALQTAGYQRYRTLLARSAARPAEVPTELSIETTPAGSRSSSGKVGVKETQTRIADNARDALKLESAVPAKPNSDGRQHGNDTELTQIANDKALTDAKSRIAELEKNIEQMQQLTMHDQMLAEAQQRAEPTVSQAPPAAAGGVKSPDAAPSKTDVAKPAKPRLPPTSSLPAATGEEAFLAQLSQWQDQIASDPVLLLWPLGLLSAVMVMIWWRSRLKKRPAAVAKIEPKAESQSVFGQAGGRNVDTSNSVFHSNFVPSVSQLDANEVDAIAEADVYIAYGRDEQAEEILLDALKHHPQRQALRVKLLEIYLARKDTQKFGAVAAEMRVMTHGQGQEWMQAALMGQQLDPGNLIYGGVPVSMTVIGAAQTAASPPAALPPTVSPPTVSPPTASPPTASPPTASSSAVDELGLKLEGLLDKHRKNSGVALSLAPVDAPPAQRPLESVPDLDALRSGTGQPAPAASGLTTDAVALKTKIDLALACDEIGDREAARELLTEVAGTHHPELASRAQSLLEQLA
ncbi:MAG: FimV/HubP family polar landmark protein [Betaproteobacteria bacterium]